MTHDVLHIGLYLIFGIILLPVYIMIIGWIVGKPRNFRSIGITVGYMFGYVVLLVLSLVILGTILSLFVPY